MKTVNLFLTSLIMLSSVSASAQQVVSENVFKDITTLAKVRSTRFAAPSPAGSLRKTGKPVAFYIGDSTMRTNSTGEGWNGQWGFGLFAQEWFDENELVVENHGWGGTTSETYYNEKWSAVKSGIKEGDFVVIDFGHNDKSGEVFVTYINKYIDEILAKGATPILCSRTPRCSNGVPSADQTYRPLGMAIAQQRGIAYIDLEAQAMPMYNDFGTWKTTQFYQDGKLHTSLLGAWHNAYCHALAIAADPSNPLHQYLKDTTPAKMNIERKAGEHYTFSIGGDDTSARGTFRSGRWMLLYNTLEKGDTVLIQFGSNELKSITSSGELGCIQSAEESYQVTQMTALQRWETVYSYGWYIHYFLNDIEAKGAVGVLVNEDGTTPAKVAAWNEELANKYNVKVLEIDDYGSCGENLFYFFNEATGTLTISGTGAMSDYKSHPLVPWYLYRNSIKKVVLNNGVTSIGELAFYGCSGLKSVDIPNSVTSIGYEAFSGCSGLTSVDIPKSVTSIRSSAFINCSSLTSIKVESGNTTYDSRNNCNAIIETSGNTLIAGCKKTIIPNSVTSIGELAFYGCSGLTSIEIPNSVTSIGQQAFEYCSGLTSTVISNSVTSIGRFAFDGCGNLTSVDIPNSVTSIGSNAFQGCFGLISIVIPNSVTTIGEGAFSNCTSLTSIKVESGNTTYDSRNNCNAIIETSSSTLIAGCKNTVIPNSVTSIGDHTFRGCSSLTSMVIPNSVTSIGFSAFNGCSGLTSIDIPNSVTSIGEWAFFGCSGLMSIVIPNSVTSIGDYAFTNCSGLTSVTCLAENVPTTDYYAFYNSPISSATLCVPVGSKAAYEAADVWKDFKEIVEIIPYGSCGDNVSYFFEEATGTLTISGTGAMSDFSDSAPWYSYRYNIKKVFVTNGVIGIGQEAFSGCRNLNSIVIPNSVTSIGESAFLGCRSMTSIVIPNSVINIGDLAFIGCRGLTSIVIPNSVTSIGSNVFLYCSGLTSIEIPNSVTSIGFSAFNGCSSLTSIEIPNSVTSIGECAFVNCSSLTSVTCLAESVPTTDSDAFDNSPIGSATLYVPKGCKTVYEAADVWKDFKEIVEIEVAPTPSSDALLSVQDTKGYIGKTVSADIDLTNSTEDLTAYQFDLTLPDGFSLSVNDKGKFLVTKTSRYEDDSQTLNISKLEGNTYRFVCFSKSNEVITGMSGAILNASLTIGESVSEGSYEATISNIVVTKTDGTQLKLSDSKFNIVVTNVIKGDANGDGEVNVSDIVEIVNYIMNKPSDKFVFAAADVNEDGEVNVTDIVKVVSIIMSANSSQAKMSAAQTEMTDNDQVQLVDNEDQTISLTLNNEGGYVASQFDLVLSDNQSLESITLNNNRTDNHILAYTKTGENRYRVLSYSLNNATYDGHSGELLDIKVAGSGDVSVEDILFVTAGETEKRFSPLHSVTTGISMTTKQAEAMDIYSVDGRLVHKQAKSMDGLERGIYIINGKKHIVR